METRAKRIRDSIEQSENEKAQANALLNQYKERLETAQSEADDIIRNAREHAQLDAAKIIAESRLSAEAILAGAKKQLEFERKAAIQAFRQEAADLIVTATGRLLEREVKSEDSRHYAEMLLNGTLHDDALLHTEAGQN